LHAVRSVVRSDRMRIAETFGRDDVWVDALRLEIRDDVVGATREQCDVIGDARPLPAGPTGLLSVWPYTTTFAFCRCCSCGTCGGHIVDLCRAAASAGASTTERPDTAAVAVIGSVASQGRPFVWTAGPDRIIATASRGYRVLDFDPLEHTNITLKVDCRLPIVMDTRLSSSIISWHSLRVRLERANFARPLTVGIRAFGRLSKSGK